MFDFFDFRLKTIKQTGASGIIHNVPEMSVYNDPGSFTDRLSARVNRVFEKQKAHTAGAAGLHWVLVGIRPTPGAGIKRKSKRFQTVIKHQSNDAPLFRRRSAGQPLSYSALGLQRTIKTAVNRLDPTFTIKSHGRTRAILMHPIHPVLRHRIPRLDSKQQ